MNPESIFDRLWEKYSEENPVAGKIHDLFIRTGEKVVNDHVALRTFDDPRVNIDIIAKPFIRAGYQPAGEYYFKEKSLNTLHGCMPLDTGPITLRSVSIICKNLTGYQRSILF